ncbi:MAG TPA: DUF885 domain-containing protein [Thermoanaerobaculia bacterium]|nr:DUF885 domain-containing protein [Thermoanaerobaculia bacterium]
MHRLVPILLLACLGAACAERAAEPAAEADRPASPELARLVDEYFDAAFEYAPTRATEAGIHDYDGRIEDLSAAAFEARAERLHHFLESLEALDPATFSFDDRIDAQMIENDIRSQLLDIEVIETWKNPMLYAGMPGYAIGSLIKRDFAPASERLASVASRLEGVPAVYEAARLNLANPPKEFTDLAIRMSGGSAGYFEGTVAEWAREAAGSDRALLERFTAANEKAVSATRSFHRWLQDDLLPRSNGRFAIGAEAFARKLAWDEMIEAPLDLVLARGEARLARDYDALVEVARKIDPDSSPREVLARLESEHPSAEELVPAVRRTVDLARRFVEERGIATIPSPVPPRVEETPPYARAGGFASMDTPGPFETNATEAYYYVTPVEEEWSPEHKEEHLSLFNPWVVAMINVHEAYPGHYLQFLYAPRFPTKTRKLLYCGTNVEGWAHYSEQMMVDEGFGGDDPRYRLAQLQEALLRDVRYVAGIRLHTQGWTVEQAAKLFEEKAFQQPANAYEEARRGAYNPTYLYYTLGKLDILDLRDEYMKRKGASLREFHDAFVAQGGLPIPLIRQILFREES